MRTLALLRREAGFTIQELMVVLIVGSLLVSFSVTLFLFANKLFHSWQKKSEVSIAVARTLETISLDIMQSNQISGRSDSSLVLQRGLRSSVKYLFDGDAVWRNEQLISPAEMKMSLTLSPIKPNNVDKFPEGLVIDVLANFKGLIREGKTQATIAKNAKEKFLSTMKGSL